MEAHLQELLTFLHDKNPQVRQIALSNLLSQTPKESPHRNIFYAGLRSEGLQRSKDPEVIRDLKLLSRDSLAIAHDAFRALVNLSDESVLIASLSEPSFLTFIVAYILNPQSILADLAAMLLSNLTVSSATCSTLLSLNVSILPDPNSPTLYYPVESRSGTSASPSPHPSGETRTVLALPLLVDAFVHSATVHETLDVEKRPHKGSLHFLSSVFANLSISPAGRMFFLTPQPSNPLQPDAEAEYYLSKLLVFTEHKDTIRRGGVASTLKNCTFHVPAHRAMLSPESEVIEIPPSTLKAPGMNVLPYLLLPLAGPEEFDLELQDLLPPSLQFLPPTKVREPDPVLRLTHIETLLLFCTTHWGREHLRNNGVYEVVRVLHETEQVDKISEHVERLVVFLKGDEGPETAAHDAVLTSHPKIDDVDDEDNRIEEI